VHDLHIRQFDELDRSAVVALWQQCGLTRPWNDPDRDIDRKVAHSRELFVVGSRNGAIAATMMVGYEGHRGWINYLAVDPAEQGSGVGAAMMAEAERLLADVGCAKINLQIRQTNLGAVAFYNALGYSTDEAVSMGKRLVSDR
jgi:ribosomal protein S18 acetylase RimI-like enzyme